MVLHEETQGAVLSHTLVSVYNLLNKEFYHILYYMASHFILYMNNIGIIYKISLNMACT